MGSHVDEHTDTCVQAGLCDFKIVTFIKLCHYISSSLTMHFKKLSKI